MSVDNIDLQSLQRIGNRIRKQRELLGLTQENLAHKSGYSDRIIRNIEQGYRTKIQTLRDVCAALSISDNIICNPTNIIADEKYGAYNLAHYEHYIGFYFAYRRDFPSNINFLQTIYKIFWSEEVNCLVFSENQHYDTGDGKTVDFSQAGKIYINNDIGLIHFVTSANGAMRLLTLSKLRRDDNTMSGVVLTQARTTGHYFPAVSPIYLRKQEDAFVENKLDNASRIIGPDDDEYSIISNFIEEIENETAYFPTISAINKNISHINIRRNTKNKA